eukprot:3936491-Rhodomonas_salina.5
MSSTDLPCTSYLRACYALSGTDIAYATTRPLLPPRMVPTSLCRCYVISGTDLAYADTRDEAVQEWGRRTVQAVRYSHSDVRYSHSVCLCAPYAMPGTHIAYAATSGGRKAEYGSGSEGGGGGGCTGHS